MELKMPKFKKIPKSTQQKTLSKVQSQTKVKTIVDAIKKASDAERKSGITASRPKAVKSDNQKSVKAYKTKK